ncbi:meiotic recombination [Savitreella phatthalungensis]
MPPRKRKKVTNPSSIPRDPQGDHHPSASETSSLLTESPTGDRRHSSTNNDQRQHGINNEESARESTIRILIATDNHIGYNERDPVRGDDSFVTFREIMHIARQEDVDMILLAGDLFHDNKPSRKSMYETMKALRLNCLGDKPCELEVLGDQGVAVEDNPLMRINYEDHDINVSIPVFSIHGNHDDPSGEGHLCALDILQAARLVNYFGRVPESNVITVKPVLLQKGTTKLALFGLSNIRDERLYRSFRQDQVRFLRPELYQDEWFNLLAVHQNHFGHTETSYLPENFLQNFFDFVVWGHEHECCIDPILNTEQDFYVCQPGSSVATALSAGESVQKHVAVLSVRDREWNINKIPLKTVRPFVLRDISLAAAEHLDPRHPNIKSLIIEFLMEQVNEAIDEAHQQWRSLQCGNVDPNQVPPLPLIRLRVDYSAPGGENYEVENPQRFSQRFVGRVANANDILQLHQRKKAAARRGKVDAGHQPDLSEVRLDSLQVSALVKQYLEGTKLKCLPENELEEAVTHFIDKGESHAVKAFLTEHLKAQVNMLVRNKADERHIDEELHKTKEFLAAQGAQARQIKRQQQSIRDDARVSDFSESDEDSTTRPVAARRSARSGHDTLIAERPDRRTQVEGRQNQYGSNRSEGSDGTTIAANGSRSRAPAQNPGSRASKKAGISEVGLNGSDGRAPRARRPAAQISFEGESEDDEIEESDEGFRAPVLIREATEGPADETAGVDQDDEFMDPTRKGNRLAVRGAGRSSATTLHHVRSSRVQQNYSAQTIRPRLQITGSNPNTTGASTASATRPFREPQNVSYDKDDNTPGGDHEVYDDDDEDEDNDGFRSPVNSARRGLRR